LKKFIRKFWKNLESKISVIGITGGFGSGKTTAASFFESKGFPKITLSGFLEKEAKKRGLLITRKNLQDIGNQWRRRQGGGILAKKALGFAKERGAKKIVVDGIRNIKEVEEFRSERFVLIAIEVSDEARFERLKKLKRREDLTWELFKKLDRRDMGESEESFGLQLRACMEMADIHLINEGSMAEFKKKLDKLLNQYES